MSWSEALAESAAALFASDSAATSRSTPLAVQSCRLPPVPPPVIVAVGFADVPHTPGLFSGSRAQYVNLSDASLSGLDPAIDSANQIGRRPPVFVKVSPEAVTVVTLRLVSEDLPNGFAAGSDALTLRELGFDHLAPPTVPALHTTNERGELLLEPGFELPVLAGRRWRVVASVPGGASVTSGNAVEVKRRLYLEPVVHYAAGRRAALAALNALRRELQPYDIDAHVAMTITGNEFGVCRQQDLPQPLNDIADDALASTATRRARRPHSLALIFGEFVPLWLSENVFELEVARGADGSYPTLVNVPLVIDHVRHWAPPLSGVGSFVEASAVGLKPGLMGLFRTIELRPAEVGGLGSFTQDVNIDLTRALATLEDSQALTVQIRLRTMTTWGIGWANPGHPMIYLNFLDPRTGGLIDAQLAANLVLHEAGHKLHLAAGGDAGQPDRQPHWYDSWEHAGRRHQGPHCRTGLASSADPWDAGSDAASACIMWGATGSTAKHLCSECNTSLRKMNLAGGF